MIECAPLTLYSMLGVTATIDNRKVVGFAEGDDVIMLERNAEIGTPKTGADGSSVVSITANQSAKLTFKLMPNSAMNDYLERRAKIMRGGGQVLIAIAIRDTSNGEGGGCTSAVIIKEPDKGWGAEAGEREWEFFCNCWSENVIEYNPASLT